MAWPFTGREAQITAGQLLGFRTEKRTNQRYVSRDTALKHSAVWACLRLRADLISQMEVQVKRKVGDLLLDVPPPPVLQTPGGSCCDIDEFLYSTQVDLDGSGNTFGLIKMRDGLGLPSMIELVTLTDVVVEMRGGVKGIRIAGELQDPLNVWHEKQYTIAGLPVGLAPLAYGAASIGGYLAAQSFAMDWFSGSGMPAALLKNKARKLDRIESQKTKDTFKASVTNGDVFVTGADWDYSMVAGNASQLMFIEERSFGLTDACRFLGVPADMIEAEAPNSGGKMVYSNITQRNVQMLIMNLGGAVQRRERALSKLTPAPRQVKLDPASLLRMDLKSRYEGYQIAINSRFMAPSEARTFEDWQPFTPDQVGEIDHFFAKTTPPVSTAPQGVSS